MSVEEFFKERAVNITVGGTYSLPNWYSADGKPRTFPCRTTRISPFRMMVEAPVVGKTGDRLTSYFRDFGKLDGCIIKTGAGAFLADLEMPPSTREKLASKLSWLEKKQKDPRIPDARKDARIIPESSHSSLILADGTIHRCAVVDMSASGVAVSTELQPPVGTPLAIGACIGRVVRRLPDGFAIEFVEPQNLRDLNRLVARFAGPLRASA